MQKLIIVLVIFGLVGCGATSDEERSFEQPFDGVWVLEEEQPAPNATDVKVTVVDPSSGPIDPCQGVKSAGATMDSGLLRISEDGNVLAAKNISLAQQSYEWVGRLGSNGLFVPTLGTESEYVSAYSQLATAVVSVKPLIYFSVDDYNEYLYMDIQVVTNSATGVQISGVVRRKKYRRITIEEEAQTIEAALLCLK